MPIFCPTHCWPAPMQSSSTAVRNHNQGQHPPPATPQPMWKCRLRSAPENDSSAKYSTRRRLGCACGAGAAAIEGEGSCCEGAVEASSNDMAPRLVLMLPLASARGAAVLRAQSRKHRR